VTRKPTYEALEKKISAIEKELSQCRQSEKSLGESKEMLENIIDGVSTLITYVDRDERYRFVNRAYAEWYGLSREELIGKRVADILNPDVYERVSSNTKKALSGQSVSYENRAIDKDGNERYVSVSYEPHFRGAEVTGFFTSIANITERKHIEEKYRFLAENMNDILWIMDMSLRTVYVTPSIEAVLGFTQEERLRQNVQEQLTPGSLSIALDALAREQALENQGQSDPNRKVTMILEFYHKDGSTRWLETIISGIRDDQGVLINLYGLSRNVTERIKTEEKLRESEERYRRVSSVISDIVYSCKTDEEGSFCIDWMTGAAERISGYSIEEIKLQKCWHFLVVEEDLPLFEEKVTGLIPGTQASCELRIRRKDGETAWVASYTECAAKPENPGCRYLYGGLIDINERKQAQQSLQESERTYRELSIIDSLTQLYNSRHFYHQIIMEISRADRYGQPLTLLFLDLDDFKRFNDTYGHIRGDKVLSRLGQVIKKQLRQTDSAYRYGGEEFIMILPMTTTANGIIIAERIRSEFKKENFSTVLDKTINMTVSIGIAQYRPGEDMKDLINRVDQRMYRAKKDGKDRFCSES
jgi:diguanylate cyclase (GGDEF)-like protein/PAS domain S-box-containing protein